MWVAEVSVISDALLMPFSAHSATRLLAGRDLNKLFNIDMYCLSIDIWFTATIVNLSHTVAVFVTVIDLFGKITAKNSPDPRENQWLLTLT